MGTHPTEVKTRVTAISITGGLHEQAKQEAKRRGLSFSKFVSICISEFLKRGPTEKRACQYGIVFNGDCKEYCADYAECV